MQSSSECIKEHYFHRLGDLIHSLSKPWEVSFKRGLPFNRVKDLLTEVCGAKAIYN